MGKFEGKVVIVTGASSGIGEATAIAFAKEGAKLAITGRNVERLTAVGKKCKEAGSTPIEITGDLVEMKVVESIIQKTVDAFGGIDILVNNAGGTAFNSIEDLTVEDYDRIFDTNLKAPVFLCKNALPYLKTSKGCVVNVSSVASMIATPGNVPYNMTKNALDHFARGFAAECSSFGVRINNINPALVHTRIVDNVDKAKADKFIQNVLKRQNFGLIMPEQVAEYILFLSSAEMITGIALPVDGAYMLNTM